jgi:hypothetical protein
LKRIIAEVDDYTFMRLVKLKAEQGFKDESWAEWLKHLASRVNVKPTITDHAREGTKLGLTKLWMMNFAENLPFIRMGKTVRELVPEGEPNGRAVVIGRGPSLYRRKHLKVLRESSFEGVIIATDSVLIDCLKEGVTPHYVTTVDGSPIVKQWFDNPLVDKHGDRIKAVVGSQVHNTVVKRIMEAGMPIYWFQPSYDNIKSPSSLTRMLMYMTCSDKNPDGLPAIEALGNVGALSFVFAWTILKRKNICLIGFDYGYPADMPLKETYYFKKILGMTSEFDAPTYYERIYHPYFKTESVIDPAFKTYRENLFELLYALPDWVRLVNCTEGGTLFHPRIECMYFKQWLKGDE